MLSQLNHPDFYAKDPIKPPIPPQLPRFLREGPHQVVQFPHSYPDFYAKGPIKPFRLITAVANSRPPRSTDCADDLRGGLILTLFLALIVVASFGSANAVSNYASRNIFKTFWKLCVVRFSAATLLQRCKNSRSFSWTNERNRCANNAIAVPVPERERVRHDSDLLVFYQDTIFLRARGQQRVSALLSALLVVLQDTSISQSESD